jgi:hypothetical protein
MPATMTTVDGILKEVYGPRLVNQLQNETLAIKRIERTNEGVVDSVGGKYVDFPIKVSRNSGIGYRNELEALPTAGQQGYAAVHVPLRYGYGRARVSGQVMDLAETNYQAFASGLDNEMEGLKDDLAKDTNRVAYNDASGLMASLTDATTSATHTVDNAQYLEIGMIVDVLTRSNGATVSLALTISDIVGLTVTFSASFTAALTAGVYRQGNYGREPAGFGLIVDDTATLHGLNPATQRKWAATILANGGVNRALSEALMIQTCDGIRTKSGKRPSVIFMNLGVRRAYFNLLTQQRRYTDTKEFAGGFQGLPFNYGKEIPAVEDVDARPNRMTFVSEDTLKIFRAKAWAWMDKDNSILKWVQGFDAWEGIMKQYWEMGTSQRNAHGELRDVTEG